MRARKKGVAPASSSSADILVSAFRAFGTDAPNHCRGPFAGVITDGHRLWGFRDHLGFQPLFFTNNAQQFLAATEVKQVIAGAQLQPEPDVDVLEHIFYATYRQDTPSPFKGVSRLPHASTLEANQNGITTQNRTWFPERLVETGKFSSYEEVKERFDELFERAVARCLTGEDIVSLSGGVDSPAVAGYAAPLFQKKYGRSLPALSLVFPHHPKVDETPYIQAVTRFLGMELHTWVSKDKILDDLLEWVRRLDGPLPTITAPQLLEFYLEARRLGHRNILTGDIAEVIADLWRDVAGHLFSRGRWFALVRHFENQRQTGQVVAPPCKLETFRIATPFAICSGIALALVLRVQKRRLRETYSGLAGRQDGKRETFSQRSDCVGVGTLVGASDDAAARLPNPD